MHDNGWNYFDQLTITTANIVLCENWERKSGAMHDGWMDTKPQHMHWVHQLNVIGTWDSWDMSPPSLEIMGTKCIWLPPTFATDCNLESRPDLLANLRGKGKRSMKGNGRNMGEAITGDWEETEDEKGGHRHPPHVRSPPTFQPWLHLCWMQCHAVTIYCIA